MALIAHLSDPHLDGEQHRAARLGAVLEKVSALAGVEAVVVTGDLADTGAPDEYEQFFALMNGAGLPYLVVPGNHDLRAPLAAHLHRADDGPLVTSLSAGGITVVGLDSLVEGQDGGHLGQECLTAARSAIVATPGPVILALHHPPAPVGHPVIDAMGLDNRDALAALVTEHPQVIAVLAGHVHTAMVTTFAARPLLVAPGIVSALRLDDLTKPAVDTGAVPSFAMHTITASHLSTTFHPLAP